MTGADLRCDCGAGAVDVAPDMELFPGEMANSALAWHCANGCHNISGHRPGHEGFQQERYVRLTTVVPGFSVTMKLPEN